MRGQRAQLAAHAVGERREAAGEPRGRGRTGGPPGQVDGDDAVADAERIDTRPQRDDLAAYRLLKYEIGRAIYRHDGPIRVRLNTFSDVAWVRLLPESFWTLWGDYVRFYDYTKDPKRALASKHWRYPYKLTFSASERTNERDIEWYTNVGINVAVVFSTPRSQPLPTSYVGVRVIDDDKSDDSWLDASGVIVGLRAKGSMRGDTTGFVREASA